jgi:lipoprotein-anchoring transpeptidase ErfK/SrfK
MSRRLVLMILIPALAAAMVGVGVAAWRPTGSVAQPEPTPSEAVLYPQIPSPPPADPIDDLAPPARPTGTEAPMPSYDVAAAQRRLTELAYYVGEIDGKEGPATRSAIMAFQKVQGLPADGLGGPATIAAMDAPVTPSLRGGPPQRIEVDLDVQVLYVVDSDTLIRILPISSGSGQAYRTKGGGAARSLTPVGTFRIERRIRGVRHADLGVLYDPLYFYRGWAIHGSNSVPAYPASHGCIRVTRPDAVWLFDRAPVGMTVMLYGGVHTFTAGSPAPGTDSPAGDTGGAAPEASPEASPEEETPSPPPSPEPDPIPSEPGEDLPGDPIAPTEVVWHVS